MAVRLWLSNCYLATKDFVEKRNYQWPSSTCIPSLIDNKVNLS